MRSEDAARKAKFAKYAAIARQSGDPSEGRKLAQATCMICHCILGEGAQIGPDLSGAGAMGLDALLGNVLYPNDKLESGYYRHDVTLKDGSLISGFLVAEKKPKSPSVPSERTNGSFPRPRSRPTAYPSGALCQKVSLTG